MEGLDIRDARRSLASLRSELKETRDVWLGVGDVQLLLYVDSNVREEVTDMVDSFKKRELAAGEFRERIGVMAEAGEISAVVADRLREVAEAAIPLAEETKKAEAKIRVLEGTATDADLALLGLKDAADEAGGALGQTAADGAASFSSRLDEVLSKIPELKREMKELDQLAELRNLRDSAGLLELRGSDGKPLGQEQFDQLDRGIAVLTGKLAQSTPVTRTAGGRYTAPGVSYDLAGKTRDKPVQKEIVQAISAAVRSLGSEFKAVIHSGGQDHKGHGHKRTGSTRHDGGKAADFYLYRNGQKLNEFNSPKEFEKLFRSLGQTGLTGVGHYGRSGSVHAGGGAVSFWGPDKNAASAAASFKKAFFQGRSERGGTLLGQKEAEDADRKSESDAKRAADEAKREAERTAKAREAFDQQQEDDQYSLSIADEQRVKQVELLAIRQAEQEARRGGFELSGEELKQVGALARAKEEAAARERTSKKGLTDEAQLSAASGP